MARGGCVLVLLFAVWSLEAQDAVPGDTLRITLDQALEIAGSENLIVRIADHEITKQQYAEKGAYAALFPQVDLAGSFQYAIEKQKMYMDGVPGMENGIKVGRDNIWTGGVTVTLPLVSAPLWKSLKISAYDVELAVEKARSSRIEMTDQVKQAFYAVLLANEAYAVFREVYDNAMNNLIDIRDKFKQGMVAEYDLIRAQVNVKNAEPNLYDAENSMVLSRWQLKVLIGIDPQMPVECIGSLAEYESGLVGDYVRTGPSLENNSALKQIDIQQKQLEKVRQMQQSRYYPTLGAQFGYQWISMNNNFKIGHYRWDPYSTVGVSLSIPVFAGGKRRFDLRQTKVNMSQLELQRQDAERNLRLALKQATDRMSTSVKQYLAAAAGVQQAETGYAITMKRYETGEGTLLEINDSQLSLTHARLNLNQSIYNYLVAKSSLEKIVGEQSGENR